MQSLPQSANIVVMEGMILTPRQQMPEHMLVNKVPFRSQRPTCHAQEADNDCPPHMELNSIEDDEDSRELHQTTESCPCVDISPDVSCSNGEAIVGATNHKPGVAQDQGHCHQPGGGEQGHHRV